MELSLLVIKGHEAMENPLAPASQFTQHGGAC